LTDLLIRLFIKDRENIENPKVRSRYITLGSLVGILSNVFLFTVKFIIGFLSGSVSITADAFNNLSDVGSSVVTALGFKLSEKPADKEHPFGHGRIEYMSGLLVAVLIILVGVELIESSIRKIISFLRQVFEYAVLHGMAHTMQKITISGKK
jgi:cation diffusion facilitator family transporter